MIPFFQVSALFSDHLDLLEEFARFLPDTSGAASIRNPQLSRNPNVGRDDRASPMTMGRAMHVEKVVTSFK